MYHSARGHADRRAESSISEHRPACRVDARPLQGANLDTRLKSAEAKQPVNAGGEHGGFPELSFRLRKLSTRAQRKLILLLSPPPHINLSTRQASTLAHFAHTPSAKAASRVQTTLGMISFMRSVSSWTSASAGWIRLGLQSMTNSAANCNPFDFLKGQRPTIGQDKAISR